MKSRIYLDHSATTPVRPEVVAAMQPYWSEHAGNPSSLHSDGAAAKAALDAARETVAEALGATPVEIVFNGGGTEGDNQALFGVAAALRERGRHIVSSAIEHHAVLNACRWLQSQGHEVTYVPVSAAGLVDPDAVARALRPDTVLVSIMLANNEVGSIQPVRAIVDLAHARGVLVHTDAVQAIGKMPVRVDELGVDLLALTAHKFYGPKGTGALYVRRGTPIEPTLYGGHQERGLRPGTQNMPGIVGLAEALRLAVSECAHEATRLAGLRDRLQAGIASAIDDVVVNGDAAQRLPGILNVSFGRIDGESLLMALDLAGIAVSTGSACASGAAEPSHVLTALRLDPRYVTGSLRFSLGRSTTIDDIDQTLAVLREEIGRLRRLTGDAATCG
ncbi:MAG: cysteine desulfurase [Chloroflexi bacterium]|nr:cysteine desulfurase [Chloroflexota bacterium]